MTSHIERGLVELGPDEYLNRKMEILRPLLLEQNLRGLLSEIILLVFERGHHSRTKLDTGLAMNSKWPRQL
jgi:hypothetical protein